MRSRLNKKSIAILSIASVFAISLTSCSSNTVPFCAVYEPVPTGPESKKDQPRERKIDQNNAVFAEKCL